VSNRRPPLYFLTLFAAPVDPFSLNSDNPVGRMHLINTMETHNRVVEGAKTQIDTHEAQHLKAFHFDAILSRRFVPF